MATKKQKQLISFSPRGGYFRGIYGNIPVCGTYEVGKNDDNTYCLYFMDNEGDEILQISTLNSLSNVDVSNIFSSFKLLKDKREYEKISKLYFDKFLSNGLYGHSVTRFFGENSLKYSFGCGAVQYTESEILEFISVLKLIPKNKLENFFTVISDICYEDDDFINDLSSNIEEIMNFGENIINFHKLTSEKTK